MKNCKVCKKNLRYENFTKSNNIKDGYENTCKKCRSEARKKNKLNCLFCDTTFYSTKKDAVFCSSKCAGQHRKRRQTIKCSNCFEDIEVIVSKANNQEYNYCDQQCRTNHLKFLMKGELNPNYDRIDYVCDGCSKEIKVIPSRIKVQKYIYCSNECYKENIGKQFIGELNPNYYREEFICYHCGNNFTRILSANRGKRVFCSRDCYMESNKDKKIEAKIEIECPICENKFSVWRSRRTYSTRIFCSRKCANIGNSIFFSGENSPRWNHELSEDERFKARKYEEYYLWRKAIFKRDEFSCKCCNDSTGGNLIAHHILNYSEFPEKRVEVSNGITLCEICHKMFHNNYGYTKNDESQLNEFINFFNQ